MANRMECSNGYWLSWVKRSLSKNGNHIDVQHYILHDKEGNVFAKATLTADQIAAFCLNNNKI